VVSSGKGGVGKTTLVSNLSAALSKMGKSVIAMDSNLTAPNLGIHLGIHLYPKTIQDVLEGKAHIKESMYFHKAGFAVIPADISLRKTTDIKSHEYLAIFDKIMSGVDFIIIDSPAGLGKDTISALRAADEVIAVTNPELPAVTDAMKIAVMAKKHGTHNIGVVVNRVKNESHEIPADHIGSMMGIPVLGKVPEDRAVRRSISIKEPVVISSPSSPAAQHFMAIAAKIAGEEYEPKIPIKYRIFPWTR
jgi:septum site-determining protein MinD